MEDIAIVYLIQHAHLRLHALRKFVPHVTLKFVLKSSHRLWKSLIWWPMSFKNVVFFYIPYRCSYHVSSCIFSIVLVWFRQPRRQIHLRSRHAQTVFGKKKTTCFSKVRNFWCVPVKPKPSSGALRDGFRAREKIRLNTTSFPGSSLVFL